MEICIPGRDYMEGGVEILLNDCMNLKRKFGEKNMTAISILKNVAALYPPLSASGCGLHAPVAIVVEDWRMAETVCEELRGFGDRTMVGINAKRSEVCEHLLNAEYEFVPFSCLQKHERNTENLSLLCEAMSSKMVCGKKFSKFIAVFFVGGIPPELASFFAGKVLLEKPKASGRIFVDGEKTVRDFFVMYLKHMPEIQKKIDAITNRRECENAFLSASIEITHILLHHEAADDPRKSAVLGFWKIYENSLLENWNIITDYAEWFERLREEFFKNKAEIFDVQNRETKSEGAVIPTDKTLIYDKKYYYITKTMFSKAAEKFKHYVSMTELKNALAQAGILSREGRERVYYTVKVTSMVQDRIYDIGRRMRIQREWMDKPGELTWAEQINQGRRKEA